VGTVHGRVRVQLYSTSELDGERRNVAWEDTEFGDTFSFGAIMVSATQDAGAGSQYYRGTDTISTPPMGGDD